MATTAATQSEKEFASNYLTLLSVSNSKSSFTADFKRDLRELKPAGVKLPNLPIAKKSLNSSDSTAATVCKCTVKSIKPPRFNVTVDVKSTDTIYQVKSALCETEALEGYEPSLIKLLLKGKVIQDSSVVSEVSGSAEDVTFTAIVTPKKAVEESPQPTADAAVALPWKEIAELLQAKGFDSNAIITRLQKGWELTE